jgi:hypothetical protein
MHDYDPAMALTATAGDSTNCVLDTPPSPANARPSSPGNGVPSSPALVSNDVASSSNMAYAGIPMSHAIYNISIK